MGGKQDCGPTLLVYMLDKAPDTLFCDYIQPDGWFGEKQQLGIVQSCNADISPHALPER